MFILDNMKKIITIAAALVLLTSCETGKNGIFNKRQFTLRVISGENFTYTETWVECDSFQMVSQTEALIWVDGHKMKILGDRGIRPESN